MIGGIESRQLLVAGSIGHNEDPALKLFRVPL
jgi:hypothetical protein